MEFALVMPVLFALLLGVIDYGLWFNDSISVRQGVREAARKAAVQTSFGASKDPVTSAFCTASGMDGVACGARAMSVTTGGTPYARVFVASASTGNQVSTWLRGDLVVICVAVKAKSFTGFVPLPANGVIRSKTLMSIENPTPVPSPISHTSETDPSGESWSWCTAS
ncbi:MAG: TadE/TadG family type IV pilus assembly protein [Lapillicoccus sp.]